MSLFISNGILPYVHLRSLWKQMIPCTEHSKCVEDTKKAEELIDTIMESKRALILLIIKQEAEFFVSKENQEETVEQEEALPFRRWRNT